MKNIVIPAKAGISLSSKLTRGISAFAGMTIILLFSLPAFAAPYEYAPATCDFSTTFPEKPFIEKKCDPAKPESCEEVVTFTQSDLASSLNFRITCNKQDADKLAAYKPDDLKDTLASMVKDAGLTPYATDSAVLDGIKTSIAMATGKRGDRDVIYIGQMWLGKNSALTLEGQMIGPENKKIEGVYTNILQSIKNKTPPVKKTP